MRTIAIFLIVAACSSGIFISCSSREGSGRNIIQELPDSTVLLDYRGGKVLAGDVRQELKPRFERIRDEVVQAYRKEAEKVALERLLEDYSHAQGYKRSTEYLASLKAKIQIRDADVVAFMKQNKLQKKSETEIRAFLADQAWLTKISEINHFLIQNAQLQWIAGQPRHEFPEDTNARTNGHNYKGAANAKVIVHAFCDFSSPLCAPARVSLEQILIRHGDVVKIVFHPLAQAERPASTDAAVAAFCAARQDRFWALYGLLFDYQARLSSSAANALLLDLASKAGLERTRFEKCLSEGSAAPEYVATQNLAKEAGVLDTPAFFVNGIKALSVDQLIQSIEDATSKSQQLR